MAVLYIDRRGIKIKVDNNALVCYENDERVGTVPLTPLERIFMRGEVELSASVLSQLGQRNIGVVIIGGQGMKPQMLLPNSQLDPTRRINQYHSSLNPDFCLQISKDLVKQKIDYCLEKILAVRDNYPKHRYEMTVAIRNLKSFSESVANQESIASLRGLEGAASVMQFRLLALMAPVRLQFRGRNRRPPRDPLNAVLSLGYTMLQQECILACHGAGLDPAIGYYHKLRHARASLACDIMEPLRPDVDYFALSLFKDEHLDINNFNKSEKGCLLNKESRGIFYHHYQRLSENMRKTINEKIRDIIRQIPDIAVIEREE